MILNHFKLISVQGTTRTCKDKSGHILLGVHQVLRWDYSHLIIPWVTTCTLIYHKRTCIWLYHTLCHPLSGQRRRFIKKPQNFSGFWSHRTPSFSPSRISQSWCRVFRDLRDFLLEVDLCVLFCLSGAELLLLSTWELVIDTSSDPSYKQTNTVSTITDSGLVFIWFLNNTMSYNYISYNLGNINNFYILHLD